MVCLFIIPRIYEEGRDETEIKYLFFKKKENKRKCRENKILKLFIINLLPSKIYENLQSENNI